MMVLFTEKGKKFNNEMMWDAIMARREVAIMEQGKMMGPILYRNTLQMLLLDRVYLEEIRYQLHAPEAYQNTIFFYYEQRTDTFTDYTYGNEVTCALRMEAIEVYHGSRRLRRYQLEYKNDLIFSLLKSVGFADAISPNTLFRRSGKP